MKAMQYTAFGDSGVLKEQETGKPAVKDNEVLIKIKATTVNPMDMKIRSGALQKMLPVQFPYTPGLDVSGTIEETGNGVSRLKVGDEVFATTFGGTYTEYISLPEDNVSLKPKNLVAGEAAALAVPLVTSYSVLVETAGVLPGQKVLILGAAGGVGNIMVQVAKALGAYVIGTASGEGLNLVKTLGADEVIDYKTEDITKLVKDVDVVADLVGGETQKQSFSVLKKGGKLVSIVMPPPAGMAEQFGVSAQFISSTPSHVKLDFGRQFVEDGKIKAEIAKTLPLSQAAEAQDLVSKGGLNGKVVMEVG